MIVRYKYKFHCIQWTGDNTEEVVEFMDKLGWECSIKKERIETFWKKSENTIYYNEHGSKMNPWKDGIDMWDMIVENSFISDDPTPFYILNSGEFFNTYEVVE